MDRWAEKLNDCGNNIERLKEQTVSLLGRMHLQENYQELERILSGLVERLNKQQEQVKQCGNVLENIVKLCKSAEAGIMGRYIWSDKLYKEVNGDVLAAQDFAVFRSVESAIAAVCGLQSGIKDNVSKNRNILCDMLNSYNAKKDVRSDASTILKVLDSWGGIKEAGNIRDIISYTEDLAAFWTEDNNSWLAIGSKGCNLADSSIGMWKGAYDYCSDFYKNVETGFFGIKVQKGVECLGIAGGCFGLAGSIMSIIENSENETVQSMVADGIGSLDNVVSIGTAVYDLKHIGGSANLSNTKAGFWKNSNVYGAIATATIESAAQGIRSHEKYYADGKWDLGDTGAIGIDISIAGIYGIGHELTLGLDNFIYAAVDSWSGGNGTDDMSYIEKAAEGYKMLGQYITDAIAEDIKQRHPSKIDMNEIYGIDSNINEYFLQMTYEKRINCMKQIIPPQNIFQAVMK